MKTLIALLFSMIALAAQVAPELLENLDLLMSYDLVADEQYYEFTGDLESLPELQEEGDDE